MYIFSEVEKKNNDSKYVAFHRIIYFAKKDDYLKCAYKNRS